MNRTEWMLSHWTEVDYIALKQHLKALADPEFLAFHQRLVPNADNLLGIRIPVLRKLAKEIAKGEPCSYFPLVGQEYYEEVMLYGILLGVAKLDFSTLLRELDRFVPMIDNWAVCDTAVAGLKLTKKHPEEMLDYLKKHLKSEEEFALRFAVVMLMDYYLDDAHIDFVLEQYGKIRHSGYYVKMAVAWGLSLCLIKYRENTLRFLEEVELDSFTYQKALQKAIESNRISAEDKAVFRKMKAQKTS